MLQKRTFSKLQNLQKLNPKKIKTSPPFRQIIENIQYENLCKRNSVSSANTSRLKINTLLKDINNVDMNISTRHQSHHNELDYYGQVKHGHSMCFDVLMKNVKPTLL